MKLARRFCLLLTICICLIGFDSFATVHCQGTCPERDACRDAAYAIYSDLINDANEEYMSCIEGANSTRNSCLDSAEFTYNACADGAAWTAERVYYACVSNSDPYDYEDCENEAWSVYWSEMQNCNNIRQAEVDSCWTTYWQYTHECEQDFISNVNRAQQFLSDEYSRCDTLCP